MSYLLDALQQAGVNYHTETAFELGKPRISKIVILKNFLVGNVVGGQNYRF